MIYVCENTRMTAKQMFLYYIQKESENGLNIYSNITKVLSYIFTESLSALRSNETDLYTVLEEMKDLYHFLRRSYPKYNVLISEYLRIYEGFEDCLRIPNRFVEYATEKQIQCANQLFNTFDQLISSHYELAMVTEMPTITDTRKMYCSTMTMRSMAKFFVAADNDRISGMKPYQWEFSDDEKQTVDYEIMGVFFKCILIGCINEDALFRFFIIDRDTNKEYYSEMKVKEGIITTNFV